MCLFPIQKRKRWKCAAKRMEIMLEHLFMCNSFSFRPSPLPFSVLWVVDSIYYSVYHWIFIRFGCRLPFTVAEILNYGHRNGRKKPPTARILLGANNWREFSKREITTQRSMNKENTRNAINDKIKMWPDGHAFISYNFTRDIRRAGWAQRIRPRTERKNPDTQLPRRGGRGWQKSTRLIPIHSMLIKIL